MDLIIGEILKALGYLLLARIAYAAWDMARGGAKGGKQKEILWKGFLWCAGIAFVASVMMGSPTCEYKSDPVYGGCEQYADDGYEATTEERAARFALFLTFLYVPVVFGALKAKRE
jgi:hypothetical protein